MNNDPKNSIKQFLKKKIEIEEKKPEDAKDFIRRKLIDEPEEFAKAQKSIWNKIRSKLSTVPTRFMFHKQRGFKRFMNESFPFVCFLGFSCYIVYLMEYQYTQMKDKVMASKSLKQIQVEQEDEEIRHSLFGEGDPALKQTYLQEKNRKQKYKFEDFGDDEDDESEFSTKGDLIERIYTDSLKGDRIPAQYLEDVKNFAREKEEKTS